MLLDRIPVVRNIKMNELTFVILTNELPKT